MTDPIPSNSDTTRSHGARYLDQAPGLNQDGDLGITILRVLQKHTPSFLTEDPMLALCAGTAGSELKIKNELGFATLVAIDLNPELDSIPEIDKYIVGNMFEVLPGLPNDHYGLITALSSDGAITNPESWTFFWKEIKNKLKSGGLIVMFPYVDIASLPNDLEQVYSDSSLFIAKKGASSFGDI